MVFSTELDVPTSGWTVAVARRALDNLLRSSGVAATAGADLLLALSEACANAVRHAAAGRSYRVRLCVDVVMLRPRGIQVTMVENWGSAPDAGVASGGPVRSPGRREQA